MNAHSNILILNDDRVIFEGFDKLGDVVTLNLLPAGLTLIDGDNTKSFCCHTFKINKNRESFDAELVQILKDRGLETTNRWICVGGIYYESQPHRTQVIL